MPLSILSAQLGMFFFSFFSRNKMKKEIHVFLFRPYRSALVICHMRVDICNELLRPR